MHALIRLIGPTLAIFALGAHAQSDFMMDWDNLNTPPRLREQRSRQRPPEEPKKEPPPIQIQQDPLITLEDAPAAPPAPAPAPPVAPPPGDDTRTEAGITRPCPNCAPNRPPAAPERMPIERIQSCYGQHLLAAAKANVKSRWGNRTKSGGQCALGVRGSLDRAGMNPFGGLGDAAAYHGHGKLRKLGFKNIMAPGITAENAPPGAVLVFYGPNSENWIATGNRGPGRGAGRWAGHITIKGDDGWYYTDGRTRAPAVSRRRLVGIYVMETCAHCSSSVKRKCGGDR